jgi:RNA polymerase sigma factor (sigma-70 family)
MKYGGAAKPMEGEQNLRMAEAIAAESKRLRDFIRHRVADRRDAEDILQDVFFELLTAFRMSQPIEHLSAWLYRVARNRITDLMRGGRGRTLTDAAALEDLLPSPEAGPEAAYARAVLLDEVREALNELPEDQREVFIAHEIEGRSFKEIAAQTGESVNTLLSRKHYAVLHLRRRLKAIYREFTGKEES